MPQRSDDVEGVEVVNELYSSRTNERKGVDASDWRWACTELKTFDINFAFKVCSLVCVCSGIEGSEDI
jgi:hypothetical protein